MIPAPTVLGELPPGIHPATWAEILAAFGTNPRRRLLCEGLRRALVSLQTAGVCRVFLDFFQRNRADAPKGILALDLGEPL